MSSELGLTPLALMGVGFGIVSCWLSTLANIHVKRDHKEVRQCAALDLLTFSLCRREFLKHRIGIRENP